MPCYFDLSICFEEKEICFLKFIFSRTKKSGFIRYYKKGPQSGWCRVKQGSGPIRSWEGITGSWEGHGESWTVDKSQRSKQRTNEVGGSHGELG